MWGLKLALFLTQLCGTMTTMLLNLYSWWLSSSISMNSEAIPWDYKPGASSVNCIGFMEPNTLIQVVHLFILLWWILPSSQLPNSCNRISLSFWQRAAQLWISSMEPLSFTWGRSASRWTNSLGQANNRYLWLRKSTSTKTRKPIQIKITKGTMQVASRSSLRIKKLTVKTKSRKRDKIEWKISGKKLSPITQLS